MILEAGRHGERGAQAYLPIAGIFQLEKQNQSVEM